MGRAENRKQHRQAKAAVPDAERSKMKAAAGPRPKPWLERVLDGGRQQQERQAAAAAESAEKLSRLMDTIPPELRDSPEAKLMVSRVVTTWSTPVHPNTARAWQREWEDFLVQSRRGRMEHAANTGLWVPGMQ